MSTVSERLSEKVRVFSSKDSWIEGNAVTQLRGTAELAGMELAVGLPDLHPGKTGPVGAAFVCSEWIYPHLIGNDVGCGMALFKTSLCARKQKLDRWERRLSDVDLNGPYEGSRPDWLLGLGLPAYQADALGTLGGGNHFAELQVVERIEDQALFAALGASAEQLFVLVHSGSRTLGHTILSRHMQRFGHAGVRSNTPEAAEYVAVHDTAVSWAQANRALIGARFGSVLGAGVERLLDVPHNFVEPVVWPERRAWLHRKGATAADRGAIVIPGSRGSFSYLVVPVGDQAENAHSLPHGAGRKWARGDCRARLSAKYDVESLQRTPMGSRVICGDRELLYEEAPQAYKDVESVIGTLAALGKIQVIAVLRPLVTYKVGRAAR